MRRIFIIMLLYAGVARANAEPLFVIRSEQGDTVFVVHQDALEFRANGRPAFKVTEDGTVIRFRDSQVTDQNAPSVGIATFGNPALTLGSGEMNVSHFGIYGNQTRFVDPNVPAELRSSHRTATCTQGNGGGTGGAPRADEINLTQIGVFGNQTRFVDPMAAALRSSHRTATCTQGNGGGTTGGAPRADEVNLFQMGMFGNTTRFVDSTAAARSSHRTATCTQGNGGGTSGGAPRADEAKMMHLDMESSAINLKREGGQDAAFMVSGTNRAGTDDVNLLATAGGKTGNGNIAFGQDALSTLTAFEDETEYSGYDNVGMGIQALYVTTSGYQNVAVGNGSMFSNTSGSLNVAIGTLALAGAVNHTGWSNVAIGTNTLYANTTGQSNVAIGTNALTTNTTGQSNVAIGDSALSANSSGTDNVAIGRGALSTNVAGFNNIAIGLNSLESNTDGAFNIVLGNLALSTLTGGIGNIVVGDAAAKNMLTGGGNVALGDLAMLNCSEGTDNVSVGNEALPHLTKGESNTALGHNAGINLTDGDYNTFIGDDAGVANSGAVNRAAAFGYQAKVAIDDAIVLGDPTSAALKVGIGTDSPAEKLHVIGNICATGTIAACSDQRYKKDIILLTNAQNILAGLEPVRYRWRSDAFPEMHFTEDAQIGLIAQSVEKILPEVVQTNAAGYKAVDYARIVPVLVEAIKEQQAEIESQNTRLKQQGTELDALKRQMTLMQQVLLKFESSDSEKSLKASVK